MDSAEHDVLAYMTFHEQHRVKLHSTNPLERLNKEVKRRADVVGIFPNEDSITAPTMLPFSDLSGRRSSRAKIFGRAMDRVAARSR